MARTGFDTIPGYVLGGAVVRRPFTSGGARLLSGAVLTAEAFLGLGYAVRRLFVRDGQITPFYMPETAAPPPPGKGHVIHRGGGRYDVIHGVLLTQEAVTKDEAEALAASIPVPAE